MPSILSNYNFCDTKIWLQIKSFCTTGNDKINVSHVNIITQNKEHTKFLECKVYNMEDPSSAYQMQVWILLKVKVIISMKKSNILLYSIP